MPCCERPSLSASCRLQRNPELRPPGAGMHRPPGHAQHAQRGRLRIQAVRHGRLQQPHGLHTRSSEPPDCRSACALGFAGKGTGRARACWTCATARSGLRLSASAWLSSACAIACASDGASAGASAAPSAARAAPSVAGFASLAAVSRSTAPRTTCSACRAVWRGAGVLLPVPALLRSPSSLCAQCWCDKARCCVLSRGIHDWSQHAVNAGCRTPERHAARPE